MESKTYKDYYYILGVSPDASMNKIRDAYNELYEKFGPHASMGGQDPAIMIKTFKDITEAYECLSDPKRRKEYDEQAGPHLQKSHLRQLWTKLTGVETGAHEKPPAGAPQQQSQQQQQTSGQFQTPAGLGATAGHSRLGGEPTETRMEIEITLREAMKGTTKQLRINDQMPCNQCVHMKPIERRGCTGCRGTGYIPHERVEDFNLPSGMFDRMEVRFRGRGKYDMRLGVSGDMVVEVRLRPHSYFSVNGRDICCTVPITVYEAILGAEIEVPTATGRVIMNVRPLSQHGRVYRLKGLGLAGADLLVTVEIELPSQISGEEVALFKKLKEVSSPANPRHAIFNKLSQGP